MAILFKRASALYLSLAISGAVAIYVAVEESFPQSLFAFITIPLGLMWIYASGLIANKYAVKLERKNIALLNDECNPKDYIAFYRKALSKKALSKPRMFNLRNYILLNLSVGYLASGDFEYCKQVLDMVSRFPDTKNGALYTACFFNNLASYYIRIKELEYAENTLKNMKEVMNSPNFDKKFYEIYDELYYTANIAIQVARGNYEGAEDHFNMCFDKETMLLRKVAVKCALGDLYVRLGEHEKAASAFEYVLQNGKETYYAQKASEYLGKPLIVTP